MQLIAKADVVPDTAWCGRYQGPLGSGKRWDQRMSFSLRACLKIQAFRRCLTHLSINKIGYHPVFLFQGVYRVTRHRVFSSLRLFS